MTKEEAIFEIEAQSKLGMTAFQVLSLDSQDIEEYGDDDLKMRFNDMPLEAKAKLLSLLIDEMYDTIDNRTLFNMAMEFIDGDNRRDEICNQAKRC